MCFSYNSHRKKKNFSPHEMAKQLKKKNRIKRNGGTSPVKESPRGKYQVTPYLLLSQLSRRKHKRRRRSKKKLNPPDKGSKARKFTLAEKMFAKRWIYLARRFSLNKKNPWLQSAASFSRFSRVLAHPFDEKAAEREERTSAFIFVAQHAKWPGEGKLKAILWYHLIHLPSERLTELEYATGWAHSSAKKPACDRPRGFGDAGCNFWSPASLFTLFWSRRQQWKQPLPPPGASLSIVDARCTQPGKSLVFVTQSFPVWSTRIIEDICIYLPCLVCLKQCFAVLHICQLIL
jgi:hypothetical protein